MESDKSQLSVALVKLQLLRSYPCSAPFQTQLEKLHPATLHRFAFKDAISYVLVDKLDPIKFVQFVSALVISQLEKSQSLNVSLSIEVAHLKDCF